MKCTLIFTTGEQIKPKLKNLDQGLPLNLIHIPKIDEQEGFLFLRPELSSE